MKTFLKKLLTLIVALLLTCHLSATKNQVQTSVSVNEKPDKNVKAETKNIAKGRLLVKYKESSKVLNRKSQQIKQIQEADLLSVDKIGKKHNITNSKRAYGELKNKSLQSKFGANRWFILEFPENTDIDKLAKEYKADPNVEQVSYDYAVKAHSVPNDVYYPKQWGHNNTGQMPANNPASDSHDGALVGTAGFDARLESAYQLLGNYGDASVVIGIIDTGIDTDHPDLVNNIVSGYNFGSNNSNTDDLIGHGTMCAGIVAAQSNNSIGVAGVAGGCKIMPLKVADADGLMYLSAIQNALYYAADNGCAIVNMSLGLSSINSDAATDNALKYATNAGVLILASTGNGNSGNIDYPASSPYVLAVGAASPCGERKSASSCDGETSWGSSYGANTRDGAASVDVIAPTILPTTDIVGSSGYEPDDYFFYASGTSASSAFAAGVCALIKSEHPEWTAMQIKRQITTTATDINNSEASVGWDKYTGYGLVNAYNALSLSSPVDVAPAFTAYGPFSIKANLDAGSTVGDINATNGNGGGADGGITYSIVQNSNIDSDENLAFAINPTTGIITVNDAGDLNFSTTPILIRVRADDGFSTTDINVSVFTNSVSTKIIYVSANATGANSGTSWANAYTQFHTALGAANNGDHIWVAKGIYFPSESFELKEGLKVYGGFTGTETSLTQRNWETNKTILSGDVEHNDVNTDGNFIAESANDIVGDNTNLLVALELDSVLVDGFIVTAGGLSNTCANNGGAILNVDCTATYKNMIITGNKSQSIGGAVYNLRASPTFDNVSFIGNVVIDSDASGGAMYSMSGGNITLKNARFENNYAPFGGGALESDGGYYYLENVTFHNNSTNAYGGAISFKDNTNATLKNVVFSKNQSLMGGGMYVFRNGNITMTDVSFIENTALNGPELNCGGGMAIRENISVNATNLTFKGNVAADCGGGLSVHKSSLNLKNAVFSGNQAVSQIGGGLHVTNGGNVTITNASFNGNRSCYYNSTPMGGALGIEATGNITATNSIMWGNYPNEVFDLHTPVTINNSNVYQASGIYSGTGNINIDPKFVLPIDPLTAPTAKGDVRVLALSPIINSGNNNLNTETKDIRGQLRIQNTTIDMGAYEWTQDLDPEKVIRYVNANAVGDNDGTSWANAFTSMQAALNIALSGEEIWIAKGTYKPSSAYSLTNTPRYYHFELKNEVGIYGGFAGTETSKNQRSNFGYGGVNETILSGDIGAIGDYSDNCYHVIFNYGTGLTSSSLLNGVTVTGGNANGSNPHNRGGGMNLTSDSPTISQVIFTGNRGNHGGGAFNQEASPKYVNCLFFQNIGNTAGGGMRNNVATPTVTNCTFANNTAGSTGGGVDNTSSSAIYNNCIFWGNTATTGKQIYGTGAGTSVLNYSCYANETNDVVTVDVAVLNTSNNNITSNPQFANASNNDFRLCGNSPCVNTGINSDNTSTSDIRGKARIQNTTIDMGAYEWTKLIDPAMIVYVNVAATGNNNGRSWENAFNSLQSALDMAMGGVDIWVAKGTYKPSSAYSLTNTPRYYHFELKNEVGIYGGFAGTETAVSQRTNFGYGKANETILSGDIGTVGDYSDNSYHVIYNPTAGVTNTSILNGVTITGGNANGTSPHNRGGGSNQTYTSPTFSQVIFAGNRGNYGGGAFNHVASPSYDNCLFFNNHGNTAGGGMQQNYATSTVTNCTFSNNTAGSIGGGVNNNLSSSTYNNCIFWGNTAPTGNQIYSTGAGTNSLNYSCYANGANDVTTADVAVLNTSNNNITSNPLFVDGANNDFRLFGNSTCVNTGNNTYNALSTDIRGQVRIQNTTIDIGAYEWTQGTDPARIVISYVNQNVSGGANDGSSWSNAYSSLQTALNTSTEGTQIWVAKGTYKPSTANGVGDGTSRYYHFQMKNGVEIYGGFAGTETAVGQRTDFGHAGANETILNGDLSGNDEFDITKFTVYRNGSGDDNCYSVLFNLANSLTSSAVLDGFTVTGGNANAEFPGNAGSGMITDGCPTLRNINFIHNSGNGGGSLFYLSSTGPQLSNLSFIENCGGDGCGGLYFYELTTPATLTNGLFFKNRGAVGAGFDNVNSTTTINNATFSGNLAYNTGGAVRNTTNGTLTLNNCIIWENKANGDTDDDGTVDGNEISHSGNITTLNNCCYKNEIGDVFGTLNLGIGNIISNPLFVNGTNNDFRLYGNSPCVNTGSNNYNLLSADIRGQIRIQNTTIDMGAYEWTSGTDPASNLTTGIENNRSNSEMQVYPNPSNGLVNFHFIPENGDKTTIDIFSITGELVYRVFEGTVEQGTEQIVHFSKPLAEGLYIYKLTNGTDVKTGRLIRMSK